MPRKIYDIKPPRLTKKVEIPKGSPIKAFVDEGKQKKQKKAQETVMVSRVSRSKPAGKEKRPALSTPWVAISIAGAVVLLIICLYLFFKLPKAEIAIWPKVDTLSFQQTITAEKSVGSVDLEESIIPAQYFQATKTISQDFPATGNATNEGRASGTITLYNKYDPPTSLTLKAGTRFMSDSGKIFTTSQKIVVPAAKKSGSKITPGSIQVQVQAAEGGADYNIAPANFSVPGLKGTAFYYSIYGVSASAMAGGYSTKTKKVTSNDIQQAKDALVDSATLQAEDALKSQISADYILLDNALVSDVVSASTKTKAGAVVETFNYEVTVTSSALAFKKSDLEKFAKDYIVSQLPEEKTLLDASLEVNYSANKIDISGGKATINLDFSAGMYKSIDKNFLSLSFAGKNAGQINQIISNSLGEDVLRTQIDFWPFWVTSVPNSQKAITIELKF